MDPASVLDAMTSYRSQVTICVKHLSRQLNRPNGSNAGADWHDPGYTPGVPRPVCGFRAVARGVRAAAGRPARVPGRVPGRSRSGDFDALLELLDPDVVLRADAAAVAMGTTDLVSGARAVAETFAGRARAARPALVEGTPGAAWATGGQPRIAFRFSLAAGRIVAIEILGDPARLASVELSDGEG